MTTEISGVGSKDDGGLIGSGGFRNLDNRDATGELWLIISPEKRNQGLGAEATQLLVDYGTRWLNLRKIWLRVSTTNEGAIACYEKCGFGDEGTQRQHIFVDGTYHDIKLMARFADHG